MTLVWGWDATHANLAGAPAGQGAGYTTGSKDIKWTAADFAARPGAVRICQDAAASDATADVLDVETFAATPAEVPGWFARAVSARQTGQREGQRAPAVYCSLSVVPAVAEALATSGELGKPDLWVAHWGITMDQAGALVGTVINGLVVVGVQFANRGAYDSDVFSAAWLDSTPSPAPAPAPAPVPTTVEAIVQALPEIREGSTGPAVRTCQGLLVARYYRLGGTGAAADGIDGAFGPLTNAAVREAQGAAGIAVDGIVGPQTWPVLFGV